MLDMDCSICQNAPQFASQWGCESPAPLPVWVDQEENEYHSCPLQFVPDAVYEFLNERRHGLDYGACRQYREHANTYIEAEKAYLRYAQHWREEADALRRKGRAKT